MLADAERGGFPIFAAGVETPWQRKTTAEEAYRGIFGKLPEGLSFLAFHFNAPGDFEVVEPEFAHIRTDEYALFKTPRIAEWAREFGLEFIGLRGIRDELRTKLAS